MLFTLGCAGLLAMSVPALSQPKPHDTKQKRAAPMTSRPVSMRIADQPKSPTFGWPVLVSEARKYMGTDPTDRKRLWCATFMNMVLAKAGYNGTNSDAAKSFAQYGRRISEPRVGAIAVLTRGKKGGHVGVVSGIDATGNPIIISGNHNKRVGESVYPRSRVIAYVMPSESRGNTQLAVDRGSTVRSAPDGGLESPITELLAAIEAEQSRAEAPRTNAAPQDRGQSVPTKRRIDVTLDPAIAEFLGIKAKSQATARQPQPVPPSQAAPSAPPQRELRVEQVSTGRVASDSGLAGRLLPLSR